MRAFHLVTVGLAVGLALACDPLTPQQNWQTDDPDGSGDDTEPVADDTGGEDDPIGGGGNRNNAPRANAGRDQLNIDPGTLITLDASGSNDIDGDPLTYTWLLLSKPPGSAAVINNPTFAQAQVYVDRSGDYEVQLTVSDGRLDAQDTVRIQVMVDNQPPKANAGIDQTVNVGQQVQLSGSGSTDPDGDSLEYYWVLTTPPGSGTTLSGISVPSAAMNPSFIADYAGIFTATLEVDDGELRSAPDLVVITARDTSSGGGGTVPGTGSSGCLDCGAYDEVAMTAWSTGDLASGFGLLVFPVLVSLWQRRRED